MDVSVPNLNLKKNPFYVEPPPEIYGDGIPETTRRRQDKIANLQLSLVQRNKILKPKIPLTTRSVPSYRTRMLNSIASSNSNFNRTQYKRHQPMREMILDKRDVYLNQMFIQKKENEINKLNKEIEDSEKDFENQMTNVDLELEQIRQHSANIELNLLKQIRASEAAAKARYDIQKQLKFETAVVGELKSELSKNEYSLENNTEYDNFLRSLPLPPGCTNTFDYFNDPQVLIDYIDKIEKDNIFIQQQYDRLEELSERSCSVTSDVIETMDNAIKAIDTKILKSAFPTQQDVEEAAKPYIPDENLTPSEKELLALSEKVTNLYFNCFRKSANMPPLEMLEKIELSLEEFYNRIERVVPEFVESKQNEIDKRRAEEAKRINREAQERLYREKKEAFLERANRPVKKRNGRKLVERSLPPVKKKTPEQLNLLEEQRRQQEELLFGDITY